MEEMLREYLYQFIGHYSFTGEIEGFQHRINDAVLYTPAIERLMDSQQADWLIDAIASYLVPSFVDPIAESDPRVAEMILWKLTVADNRSAILEARADSLADPFVRQTIEYADFSLRSVDIGAAFFANYWTLYLPSEIEEDG